MGDTTNFEAKKSLLVVFMRLIVKYIRILKIKLIVEINKK